MHYFQSIHNSDIFEVRGVQIENSENRMVSQNSVNEITNFNLSCAVTLYSLCKLQMETNQLEGNSKKYAGVYFTGS